MTEDECIFEVRFVDERGHGRSCGFDSRWSSLEFSGVYQSQTKCLKIVPISARITSLFRL